MKPSTKIILPIILISALLILLTGCVVPDVDPGYTPGTTTITGIIAAPCCSTSSTAVSDAPSDWCLQCEQNWFLQKNIAVILTYEGEEIDSTTTNTQGEYTFANLSAGENYVITAICPDDGGYPLVKDVVKEVVDGEDYDAGITDCESTALGLIVDALVNLGISSEYIILEDIQGAVKFEPFVEAVCEVLENCGDVTSDDDLLDLGNLVLMEILGENPGWTGGEVICVFNPPDDPCIGVPPPSANAGPDQSDEVCPGADSTISISGCGSGKGTISNAWNFGDGGTATGTLTPSHIYKNPFTSPYTVTLTVTDECGSTVDEMIVTITESGPTADANGDYPGVAICGSTANNVTLDGSGSTAGGTAIVSWEWFDGAISLGTGETLSLYFAPGDYTVTLVVTDENGCTDSDDALVDIDELTGLTGVTFSGGPFTLCVGYDRDINMDVTIIPEFCDIPGTEITLAECLASGGTINDYSGGYFSISGTTLTGISEGSGYITITYKDQTGLCGIGDVESDPIDVIVETDAFFLMDNKGNTYGLDINTINRCIEVPHNANHVFFGVSPCIDPETIVEYNYDRSHCGGGVSAYTRVYGGTVDPTMINLCNGDVTYLNIRIGGEFGDVYDFEIYRLGQHDSPGVYCGP